MASKNSPLSLMGHLSHSLDIFFTRAVNVLETHQVLPTAAGLPLDTVIDFNLVFKSIIQKKKNDFGGLESFNFDFIFKPSVAVFIQRNMQVSLMRYTKSRVSLKSSALISLDLSTNVKFQAPKSLRVNQNLNPESRRDNTNPKSSSNGEFKIQMMWALGSEQVNFVNIKNDIYLKHNVNEIRVVPMTREYQYVNCLPDVYTAAIGRRVCFTGSYHSPATNVIEGILSLTSPFRMEGSIVSDDENLKYYLVAASWHRDLGSSSFQFKLVLEGPGTELSRLVNISLSTDRFGSIKFECKIPDVEIKYLLERKLFFNSTHHHHRYAMVLSQDKKNLSSFVFEREGYAIPKSTSLPDQTQIKFNQSSTDVNVNLNLGGVSLDLRISAHRPLATYWEKTVLLNYYCEPSLKLLYSLHPAPSLAKNEGHTSRFSYHHEIMDSMTPLEKTWMAFYKSVVIWPDNNITMTTTMAGDTKRAHRLTDVTWTYGDQMDLIKMVSDVTNKSTEQTEQYDYILHLSNRGKFDLDLVGHLQSSGRVPFRNWSIQTDVRYMEKGGNNRKAKTWWPRWLQSKISDFDGVEKHDKRKELYFWRQPTWSFGIDVSVQMTPHKAATPVAGKMTRESGKVVGEGGKMTGEGGKETGEGGKMTGEGGKMTGEGGKMTGVEFGWLINASLPRGGAQLFKTKGKVVNEIKKWMLIDLEDNIHDLMFSGQAENMMTPKVFQHQHNWTLVDTSQHTFDRSFNLRVDFEHYQRLEYDVALVTPRLNFTHHINYTKMSEGQHRVRAYIDLLSTSPKFHLLYFESTDINGTHLTTKINLTSQLLNYKLELMRQNGTFKGDLTADGMFLQTEKRFSLFLLLPSTKLPRCEMMYFYDGSSALRLDISILHPNKFRLELHSLSAGLIHNSPMKLINLALELTEPRILLTNLEVSNLVSPSVHQKALTLQRALSDLIRQGGHILANNIVADLQDQIFPFLNQSISGHLKARLLDALSSDFDGKTIRFYKLGLGVLQVLNKIYLDNPIVQLMKISQVDEAMALTVTFVSQIVSRWVRHPPFFVRQFMNTDVSPSLQAALNNQQLNRSICLSMSLPTTNLYPRLGSTAKDGMSLLKHRTITSSQISNDVGIIMAGRHVRTFDGKFYDLMEPQRKSCTYLLAADLKNGQFFVTYTPEGLTVVFSNTVITLAQDGSLSSVGSETISSLPYSSSSGNITLKMIDGYFNLSFASGLATVIFSPSHNFYIVTMDRSLNNVSLGILGTNNRETGDDYLLPSGTLAENDVTFQNSYELTGNKHCRLVTTIPRANSCNPPNMTMDLTPCTSLTDQWSTVIPCLKLINPKPFIQQCLIDVSLKTSGCNVVLAYLTACRSKGLDVKIPHSCSCADTHGADRHCADRHDSDTQGANSHDADKHRGHSHGADRYHADIVFIQSLHHSLISSHQSLVVFKRLSSSLPNTNLKVGLVTYGGDGQWKHPKAHMLNGKLLEKWKLLSDDLTVDIETGQKQVRPNEAIMAAANFPFRPSAAKFIVLAYGHEVNCKDNDNKLQLLLKDKGITLVAVSSHPVLLTSQVSGIMSNGQVIGEEKYLPLPQDAYSHLALASGGMLLNMDTIIAGQVKHIQQMANQLESLQMRKSQHQCN